MTHKNRKTGIFFPIGAKLVIIITGLLLVSLGTVTFLVSFLSTQEVERSSEYNNLTVNNRAGSHAESFFKSVQTAVLLYLDMLDRIAVSDGDHEMEQRFFSHNRNIAAIGTESAFIPNEAFLLSNNISLQSLENYFNSGFSTDDENVSHDSMRLLNASPLFQFSMITAVFIHNGINGKETVKTLFSPDDLSESFGIGINTSFIINDSGEVLLHPDNDLILGGANFSSIPIVADMKQGDNTPRQISFTDEGIKYFGVHYRLAGTDTAVITTIPHSVVFEAVRSLTFQNLSFTVAVLFIAIVFIWFFSKTISGPVRALADAALQIEGGEFGVTPRPKTRDEIGLLTESFGKMSGALNIFGRFTNKDIAVRAMRGDIKPGGLSKHATIFFSDIRGFTEKSEKFTLAFGDEASNRIVSWLNTYLTQMVDCVEKTGGVVDKFIGDAVMAHWGTAYTTGSPAMDALNCIKAALMMRKALYYLNKNRGTNDPGDPPINIGCGINTGVVTAGQIGSEQRMEYTVIGDPVNLASRTEALNKPLGTDILITEDTWELTKEKIIFKEMPPVRVKGKEKPVRMFAVINFKGVDGPKTLTEVRNLLGISTPDISKVDTDAEEKKYKIQGG